MQGKEKERDTTERTCEAQRLLNDNFWMDLNLKVAQVWSLILVLVLVEVTHTISQVIRESIWRGFDWSPYSGHVTR